MDYKKKKIPKALREQVWLKKVGKKFETKCSTTWCRNKINVFDFQCGHDIPESKGGTTDIANLEPICSRCNLSMGNEFTFKQWCAKSNTSSKWILWFRRIFLSSDTKENGTKSSPNVTSPKLKQPKLRGRKFENPVSVLPKHTASIMPNKEKW